MTAPSLWQILFGRRSRTAEDDMREKVWTWATALTCSRAAVSSAVLVLAIIEQSPDLLLAGLGISMLCDFFDGFIARARNSETVPGAQLDGLADRLATALVAAGVVSMDAGPQTVLAAGAVWLQFGVVDQFFASQFLRFRLWSSDHFYQVDELLGLDSALGERVWRLNWSPLAKLASNLPILFLAFGLWWAALLLSLALVALRIPDYRPIRELAATLPNPAKSPEPAVLRAEPRVVVPARRTRPGHRVPH
jgi:phosphatidylglycerophosphate synthase